MKKILVAFLACFSFLFVVGCTEQSQTPVTPPVTDGPNPTETKEDYVETDLDDGKIRTAYRLEIRSNGNDTIYFGETFTAEGYEVLMVYYENENLGTDLPIYSAVKLDKFVINDQKVNYFKEGKYAVKITGRVRDDAITETTFVTVKADRYESLGVKHLFGIRCSEVVNESVGISKSDIKASDVYKVYTENKYENGELILIEERMRSGYTLEGLDNIDTSKAGSYVVYVTYSETYDNVTINVKTFFTLVLQ